MPCVNICNAAPFIPPCDVSAGLPPIAATPSITNPIWLTDEYAMSLFKSVCLSVITAPYMTLNAASIASGAAAS